MPSDSSRPDPDQLLAQVTTERQQAARGKLKIFFGACPGVGKTCAMLSEARRLRSAGLDVVIGVVETHGRVDTAALLHDLDSLPLLTVSYQGKTLLELDLQAALRRRPALVLVDELAHSNAPGSPHPKRWQDVEELLAAGIDVYTTVNVQHLESLNDIVGRITGVQVRETVPDHVFDRADEVVLVDLPPDDLLQRLQAGQVYLPEQAERAARNFFRKGNLMALRELALRRTAGRVDSAMRAWRQRQVGVEVWPADESLLVCVGPQPGMRDLVRSAARLAGQLEARWHVIYLETPELTHLDSTRRQAIHDVLQLAQSLGAETAVQSAHDIAEAVVRYARQHNLSRILLGRRRGGADRFWRRALADRIAIKAPDLDIVSIARSREQHAGQQTTDTNRRATDIDWQSYWWAVVISALTTLLAQPVFHLFDIANIVMMFLVGVVVAAIRLGRGPASMVAVLNVVAFDFFFVQPRFSFAVSDVQYLFMFAVMLLVGLVIGQLTANLRFQAKVANLREQRATALYEMARELSSTLTNDGIAGIAAGHLQRILHARSAIWLLDLNDALILLPQATIPVTDEAIARWVLDHGQAAGWGTDTLPATPQLYVPLRASMRIRGVLVVDCQPLDSLRNPEQRRLLDTFAALTAMAFERVHFVDVAQQTLVNIESERLRNTLLASLSHDLRTPLTTIVGLAESLGLRLKDHDLQQQADTLGVQARGMARLVHNLLDMARLQSGELQLKPDWHLVPELAGSALKLLGHALDGHPVRLHLAEDLPLVWCDAILLERVLVNLLENAVKYTPPAAAIGIDAWVEPHWIIIRVWDEGPGLPDGDPELLFAKFVRGGRESAISGVGLGLAICRAILAAHHGRIHALAHHPHGAAFEFRLPRKTPPVLTPEDITEL